MRINPSKIIIQHKVGGLYGFTLAIPAKYLVKVDAEKKEAKFKVNDVVRTVFNETTHITAILGNGNYYLYGMGNEYPEDSLTLVEPYTEPTEQTEVEKNDADNLKKVAEEWANTVSDAIKEYGDAACEIITEARTEAYWDAYTADLAKEIVLKTVNSASDRRPMSIAEYAVSVAKAVVEGLKRK